MVWFFAALNRILPWHRLPRYLGLANLAAIRIGLRQHNLHDPVLDPPAPPPVPPAPPPAVDLSRRTPEGVYNDLRCPAMGMKGSRFGRNIPLNEAHPDVPSLLLSPSPRLVSERLLARREFKPATSLNLLAAAWIQFQIHDWFDHGDNDPAEPFQIPLESDDPWPHERPMRIARTRKDPTRTPEEDRANLPPTFVSTESHWWDASGIYGSDPQLSASLRDPAGKGHLRLSDDKLLPSPPGHLVPLTGFNNNWWIGLELLHTLFALEHNAICDALRAEYPSWDDERLFQTARLINAALIAKIHTVEWTPAILDHPTMRLAMRANWWGLAGERIGRAIRLSDGEIISGIPGSPTEHHGAPYALTEEFVSVYRMHPLMPDEIVFRKQDGRALKTLPMKDVLEDKSRPLIQNPEAVLGEPFTVADLLYTFGVNHPSALTLHNYPAFLREHRLPDPDGRVIDLAAIDIMRDRERGVPRYNRMRRLLRMRPFKSFDEITDNPQWAQEMREVYGGDIERVDLMVGMFAEKLIPGFGFSETALRIFILMASRRLKSDRFFTEDFTPRLYTHLGLRWIADNDMTSVILRHYPQLTSVLMRSANAFKPWRGPLSGS